MSLRGKAWENENDRKIYLLKKIINLLIESLSRKKYL
jgi:hypothetical protein